MSRLHFPAALLCAWMLAACAGPRPPPAPPAWPDAAEPADERLGKLALEGRLDEVEAEAQAWSASPDPAQRESGAFWRAICFLNRREFDSTIAVLAERRGRWSSARRELQAMVMLKMARQSAEADRKPPIPAQPDSCRNELRAMERRTEALKQSVSRLEGQIEKYQTLLKELESLQ